MNKSFLFLLLPLYFLFAETNWSSDQEITLKRNEKYKANLLVGVNDVRSFEFHWTLFVDNGLVFLAKYDSFNHQTILYDSYKKNAVRIGLSKEGKRGKISPYLVVFFKQYNPKDKSATFRVVTYGDVFIQ